MLYIGQSCIGDSLATVIGPGDDGGKKEVRYLTLGGQGCTLAPMNNKRKEQTTKMERHYINFLPEMWKQAKTKAGLTPLSAIIRKLVELWLAGKIDLNQ